MKMKLSILLFLFTIICAEVTAQNLTEQEIIGIWKVTKVNVTDTQFSKGQKAKLESVKNAFLKSGFHFKEDKRFSFDFSLPGMEIKNGYWKIDRFTKTIIIQEWKDKDTNKSKLMEIVTEKSGEKIFFVIPETFFQLEMVKE